MNPHKKIASLLCLTVLLGASSIARAEGAATPPQYDATGAYIGLTGGVAGGWFDAPANGSSETDWTGLYGVRAGYRALPWLAAEAIFERYHEFDLADSVTRVGDVNGWSLTANAKAMYGSGAAQGYAIAGIGVISAESDFVDTTPPATKYSSDDTEFVLRTGLGLDMYVLESLSFGTEVAFVVPFGSLDDAFFVAFTETIAYHFH